MKPKKIYVLYGGKRVGELRDFGGQTGFQYAESFLALGHQLSPKMLPLQEKPFLKNDPSFQYLPGVFCDSLPDAYGRAIMEDWFAKHMGASFRPTSADMLSYVGQNGIGALSYEPAVEEYDPQTLELLDLAKAQREARSYAEGRSEEVLEALRIAVKTVGGSFPKALIAFDPKTDQTYEERRGLPPSLEHWIVKFGIGAARKRNDLRNYPEVEIAYLDMARDCGITVPDFRFFETKDEKGETLRHLGVRRFDTVHGQRLHYASLAGVREIDPEYAYWTYGHLLETTRDVVADYRALKEQCNRMIFNVATGNLDDHAKNHGFLYDGETKSWSISPAFDLSWWGFQVNAPRAMAVLAYNRNVPFSALKTLCLRSGVDEREAKAMSDRIRAVLDRASVYLEKWEVPSIHRDLISADLKALMQTSLDPAAIVPGTTMVAAAQGSESSKISLTELPEIPKRSGKTPLASPENQSPDKGGPEL